MLVQVRGEAEERREGNGREEVHLLRVRGGVGVGVGDKVRAEPPAEMAVRVRVGVRGHLLQRA